MKHALAVTALLLDTCSSGGPPSLLVASYAQTYTQVRPCRPSSDHNLNNVLVFADPLAAPAYTDRMEDFPAGATVLKEEHDIDDVDCTGPIVEYTLMQKLATGSSRLTIDWRWQSISPSDSVMTQDDKRCINCHADCGGPPYGYAGTCSAP